MIVSEIVFESNMYLQVKKNKVSNILLKCIKMKGMHSFLILSNSSPRSFEVSVWDPPWVLHFTIFVYSTFRNTKFPQLSKKSFEKYHNSKALGLMLNLYKIKLNGCESTSNVWLRSKMSILNTWLPIHPYGTFVIYTHVMMLKLASN